HSRTHDEHASTAEQIAFREQAVQTRYSDVAEPLNLIAHQIGGDRGLLRDRKITGTRTNYRNHPKSALLTIAPQHNAPRQSMEFGFWHAPAHGLKLFGISSRCQHIGSVFCHVLKDFCD